MTTHAARPYQTDLIRRIYEAWTRIRYVLAVLPTGGGKTFCFASIIAAFTGAVCAVAHRKELVVQMSIALAREGVRHRVIGSDKARKACVRAHQKHFGRSFYDPNSQVAVAGVDTLIKCDADTQAWLQRVGLWIMDEAHHVLKTNKWGKAVAMMPNAYGLGVTATPTRADGNGLGDWNDGVFQEMVLGPTMRELILLGYLCDYRYICPPSDLNLAEVAISANGDFTPVALKKARRASSITGDVVKSYLEFARGKRGITFDTDVQSATDTAEAYRAAGVRAEVVSGDTPDDLRDAILERFRNGELDQLVNVDLFGEGFDVPAVEVVSFARPTMSLSLFIQQAGRALRILEGKTHAIIIDHVGNLVRHIGPPDRWRVWTLERRERASRGNKVAEVPMRVCGNEVCMAPFERFHACCPFCEWVPEITQRGQPAFVDGDLYEVDAATLERLRAAVAAVDAAPYIPEHLSGEIAGSMRRRHWDRQEAQRELRRVMALWGGWQTHLGLDDRQTKKKFFLQYGLDTMTAWTLGGEDVEKLRLKIESQLNENWVVAA